MTPERTIFLADRERLVGMMPKKEQMLVNHDDSRKSRSVNASPTVVQTANAIDWMIGNPAPRFMQRLVAKQKLRTK